MTFNSLADTVHLTLILQHGNQLNRVNSIH